MPLQNPQAHLRQAGQPPSLTQQLEDVIERSRSLLESGEGDEYPPVSPAAWKRASTFLRTQAAVCSTLFQVELPIPDINPADSGSLDLFWQFERHHLLINFPAEPFEPTTYYGQTLSGDQTISGRTTAQDERPDLIAWLIRKKT